MLRNGFAKRKRQWILMTAGFLLSVPGLAGCTSPFDGHTIPQTIMSDVEEEPKPLTEEEETVRLIEDRDLSAYIRLGDYENQVPEAKEISEEDVQQAVDAMLEADGAAVRGDSAAVQTGDTVVINYVGTIDFSVFDGSIANNYMLKIGSGEMVPGFENALIGMKTGETRSFTIQYPKKYTRSDLSGAEVSYRVTLQSFTRPAALDDEYARSKGYDSAAALRQALKEELEEASRTKEARQEQLWKQIVERAQAEQYPEKEMDLARESYEERTEEYAAQAEMTLKQFIRSQGLTMAEYKEKKEEYARAKVKQDLVIQAILDEKGLSLEDQESARILADMVREEGVEDAQELIRRYGELAVNETVGLRRALGVVFKEEDGE